MVTKNYMTRSTVEPQSRDEDAAMAHRQLGPYLTADAARIAFGEYLIAALNRVIAAPADPIQVGFIGQYWGFLRAYLANPNADRYEHEGIRWTVRTIYYGE